MIRVVEDGPFGSLHKLEHLKGIERLSNSLQYALQYAINQTSRCLQAAYKQLTVLECNNGDAMNLWSKKEHTVSCKQARIKLSSRWMSCRLQRLAVLWSYLPPRTRTTWTVATRFRILPLSPPRSKVSLGIASSVWRQYRAVGSIQYEAKSKSCVQVMDDLWTWDSWKTCL